MTLKTQLIQLAAADPEAVRATLQDEAVIAALQAIGIRSGVLQLHAPSAAWEPSSGYGSTLCKITATRHTLVTCKKCLHELSKAGSVGASAAVRRPPSTAGHSSHFR